MLLSFSGSHLLCLISLYFTALFYEPPEPYRATWEFSPPSVAPDLERAIFRSLAEVCFVCEKVYVGVVCHPSSVGENDWPLTLAAGTVLPAEGLVPTAMLAHCDPLDLEYPQFILRGTLTAEASGLIWPTDMFLKSGNFSKNLDFCH